MASRFAGLELRTDPLPVQVQKRDAWNAERSAAEAHFFTTSYAGRSIGELISQIQAHGVSALIDVRITPVSQFRPEFSKKNLGAALREAGIDYLHVPKLGVPRDVRGLAVGEVDRSAIWTWYDEHVVERFAQNLDEFFNCSDHPLAFMCVELDPTACHRHRLSLGLESAGLRSFDI